MTGLFISIDDYVTDPEVEDFDKAQEALEAEEYDYYPSPSNTGGRLVFIRGWVRDYLNWGVK